MDCVLEPSREAVLAEKDNRETAGNSLRRITEKRLDYGAITRKTRAFAVTCKTALST